MGPVRRLGIGIVMIVPGFVLGGAVWAWLESWWAVLGLEILMVLLFLFIISGKSSAAVHNS
ncbi:MAG: hypothetical protein ISS66_17030 [Desulfobacteraceae bacterium]|nr:hypothetical protein [Desulfobacteraceae bacterium]